MKKLIQSLEEATKSFTKDDVTSFLSRMRTRTGGSMRDATHEEAARGWYEHWSAEPQDRQRLDHYVGSDHGWDDDDEDGDGWDEEGWEDEYAGPLASEVKKKLESQFGKGMFTVDVGEKGHVMVSPTKKAEKVLR